MTAASPTDKPLNPRQELFAQGVARGLSQRAAYLAAGYKNSQHAWALVKMPHVNARIAQLMADAALLNRLNIENISRRLQALAERNESSTTVAGQNLSRQAWITVAKMNGLLDAKPTPAKTPPKAPPLEPVTEIRRVIVYPDGYATDYCGNPIDPDRPPYDPSFRYRPDRTDEG